MTVQVELKDGIVKEFAAGTTVADIAKEISMGLYRTACAARVNGEVVDLRTAITENARVDILTFDDKDGQHAFWHTASHVLAQAVKRLYPQAKLAIGPAIDDGFYYDFDTEKPFTAEDLEQIEQEMKKIVKENLNITQFTLPVDEAIAKMEAQGEIYKVELIKEHADKGEAISFYQQGEFVDLCAGPHLMSTGAIKAFKLTSATGAYWRGDEKNKMLQRIYGTAFPKKALLTEHLERLEEAKKRDHNKIGRELEYFMTSELVGQGLPLLMPNGAKVMQILQRFVEDEEEKRGWLLTKTPYMAKSDLYKVSGHWDLYHDGMFILGDEKTDDEILALRPMTCPFQYQIYLNKARSYRDLPLRYNETSTLFRNEASGEMHGLIRVRQFTLSEGHSICRPDQLEAEFRDNLELAIYILQTIGLYDDVSYRFSQWDPEKKEKYLGGEEQWEQAQRSMKEILDDLNLDYEIGVGEAAFYGPKLDIQIKNVFGKEDTLITLQIDQMIAEKFGMVYTDADGDKKHPIILHRSSIGAYERTLALLIEKYAGAFPLWLAPEQVRIIPISEKFNDYAQEVYDTLFKNNIRVNLDLRNEKVGYKIREAQVQKTPYMLIVGEREVQDGTVSVRKRNSGDEGAQKVADFINDLLDEIRMKRQ